MSAVWPSIFQARRYLFDEIAAGRREPDFKLRALIHYQSIGAQVFDELFRVVQTYLDSNWQHLNDEEGSLLPLASRDLSTEDWATIDAEFTKNFDPYAGEEGEFGELFSQIVNLTPAPYGLG